MATAHTPIARRWLPGSVESKRSHPDSARYGWSMAKQRSRTNSNLRSSPEDIASSVPSLTRQSASSVASTGEAIGESEARANNRQKNSRDRSGDDLRALVDFSRRSDALELSGRSPAS